jgi:hypothetical protein
VLSTTCDASISVAGDRVELGSDSRFRNEPDGLRLENGRAVFQVRKRRSRERPFLLQVSGGQIRVLGTRFAVSQARDRGSVTVYEGRIEFTRTAGQRHEVAAGESLAWPEPEPDAQAADADPTPVESGARDGGHGKKNGGDNGGTTTAPATAEQIIDRLLLLRSQRRYEAAAALLRRAVTRRDLPPGIRERLAYELAVIVGDELGQEKRACRLWRRFVRDYPRSNRRTLADQKLAECQP